MCQLTCNALGLGVLKGTREGILKRIQPVSIHGQISWDVSFTDVEDPEGKPTWPG